MSVTSAQEAKNHITVNAPTAEAGEVRRHTGSATCAYSFQVFGKFVHLDTVRLETRNDSHDLSALSSLDS